MKYYEAINVMEKYTDISMSKVVIEAHNMAIQALETMAEMEKRGITQDTIIEYAKFEDECVRKGFSFNSLLEAREKQIQKKPTDIEDKMWCCPNCYNNLLHKWEKYPKILTPKSAGLPYCLSCGQAIDWSDTE